MIINKVFIFSVKDSNTTAVYFKDVLKKKGFKVVYISDSFDVRILKKEDVFIYIDPSKDFPLFFEKIKCLTVAYFIDVHRDLNQRIILSNFFDYIFVAQKDFLENFNKVRKLKKKNKFVHWLPLACDPNTHFKKNLKRKLDVSFIGQIDKLASKERYYTIKKVMRNFNSNNYKKFYKKKDIGKIYSKSKIVFNKSINNDLNMRFFEGLCSGALLVTDKIDNGVKNLFSEKIHYISYKSSNDAIKKIRFYLHNEKQRKLIAYRGHKHVLKNHTYEVRLKTLLNIILSKNNENNKSPIKKMKKYQLSIEYGKIFSIFRKPQRVFQLIFIYGPNFKLILLLIVSIGKFINAKIPISPSAIKVRINKLLKERI